MGYRSKTQIAVALSERACANGLPLDWLTFDAWYGGQLSYLWEPDHRQQRFVGEIVVPWFVLPAYVVPWFMVPCIAVSRFITSQ